MATDQFKMLTHVGKHAVGNLNSIQIKTVAHGAIVDGGDIDNFTCVELDFNSDGERICRQLSDVSKKTYLIATPEARYLGEQLVDFYNAKGEHARIVVFEPGYTRFDTSAFSGTPENGKVAHFDPATKKFIIHDGSNEDYEGASAKFLVVSNEDDLDYSLGQPTCRFEVIDA